MINPDIELPPLAGSTLGDSIHYSIKMLHSYGLISNEERTKILGRYNTKITQFFNLHPIDKQPDNSGLDDGPYLRGEKPRKKHHYTSEEATLIRKKAWNTRKTRMDNT